MRLRQQPRQPGYPPNQTVPVYLPNTSNGCAKPVQIMYIGPVQPGSGSSS